MSFLDVICNASEALDRYRNLSCRNQNLDGFSRCYDYTARCNLDRDTLYYDNGYDNKPSNNATNYGLNRTITKTYSTEYIRQYQRRKKARKIGELVTTFTATIGFFGFVVSLAYFIVSLNWISFILLCSFLFVVVISGVINLELHDKDFIESDPHLDAWLKQHGRRQKMSNDNRFNELMQLSKETLVELILGKKPI